MDKNEVVQILNVAIEEIEQSLNAHKEQKTKEFYLTNAIRFIKEAIDGINA